MEPLLPPRPPHSLGCHNPRTPDRQAMDAILFVLRTSCRWSALTATGICTSSSAHRRFQDWTQAGVFEAFWRKDLLFGTVVWRHGGLPVVPIRWVLVRDPARRFAPQALLCTDLGQDPAQIVSWFVRRWSVEVTFQEVRAHLGVETQRQWSDTAIARTTPCMLALFSIVTLLAARLPARQRRSAATAAWYPKPRPTFADTLAAVRYAIWRERTLATSPRRRPRTKRWFHLPAPWAYVLCHAA